MAIGVQIHPHLHIVLGSVFNYFQSEMFPRINVRCLQCEIQGTWDLIFPWGSPSVFERHEAALARGSFSFSRSPSQVPSVCSVGNQFYAFSLFRRYNLTVQTRKLKVVRALWCLTWVNVQVKVSRTPEIIEACLSWKKQNEKTDWQKKAQINWNCSFLMHLLACAKMVPSVTSSYKSY